MFSEVCDGRENTATLKKCRETCVTDAQRAQVVKRHMVPGHKNKWSLGNGFIFNLKAIG